MSKYGDIQTPFDEHVVPTSSGAADGSVVSGGVDLGEGSQKETANASGLPLQQTFVRLGDGDVGPGGQTPWPPVSSPGTIKG